jgi:uncharacterized protein YabE (DUF348 family)
VLKLSAALVGAALLGVLYLQTRTPITIQADGALRRVHTHAPTVRAALYEAGIALDVEDAVQPALDAALAPNMVITVQRAATVRVEADGQAHSLRTQLTDPEQILSALNITLNPTDAVWVDGMEMTQRAGAPRRGVSTIVVRRAVPVSVSEGGAFFAFGTPARTVGEALWQAGLQLYRADLVRPALDAPITPHLAIHITRANPITIQADGRIVQTRTQNSVVGEVLAEVGVPLVGLDYAIPAADQPVPADGLIRVVRVREDVLTEQEFIPFETVYQAMPDKEIDVVQTLQTGVDGAKRRFIRVRYEDGLEVSRVTENESVAQTPAPQVIGYGTNIVIRTLATPDGVIEYWRSYTMYATSYSPARAGTPKTARNYGRTASGKLLVKGMVAIDRSMMPFGTRLYVPGYGFAVAEDTGGGVKGRWIDLGYDDHNYVTWHQVVTVYFLTPVPPADQIRWIIPSTGP